jgi:hypothetical protein
VIAAEEGSTMSMKLLFLGIILVCSVNVQAQNRRGHPALMACKPDIARFCSKVPPGEGRIKACMKEHLPELSEPCKEALFQAWLHQ